MKGHINGKSLHIDLWLMSCRVLKRSFELAMWQELNEAAKSQGIEYILDDESQYPEGGESITVIGEFSTYKEGQFQYSTLRSARLVG